ncbi:glycosyl transferase family 2 [Thiorhodococcus drewsii AZ1]|uniref:Glycosyl transferase family 2 n=2 Tax=Thiorhodococcus drewsii TaxID=210408 RepID=G2E5W4_9GAMM|nr:glycosyl transferase family 2 [Thiorhodococcus drewsii AZ1]
MTERSAPSGIRLHEAKGANVFRSGTKVWKVVDTPAWIELTWPGSLPSEWVLLRGRLLRRGRDFSARLIAETETGASYTYDLPISLKGTLLELIRLPPNTRHLRLQPMNSIGECELHEWTVRPVSRLERIAYRWRRVLPVYSKLSRQQRQTLGLRAITPLLDLKKAYRLAGNTRFYAPSLFYEQWFDLFGRLKESDRRRIRWLIRSWRNRPTFDILIPNSSTDSDAMLPQTLESLERQLYPDFEITSSINEANWTLILKPGTLLSEHALYWLAHEIRSTPKARLIYCDHDDIQSDGSHGDPCFKPDWSPELLRSTDYIGLATAFHGAVLKDALDSEEPAHLKNMDSHDLLLRVTERLKGEEIRHLAAPLWHFPKMQHSTIQRNAQDEYSVHANPVQAHLDRLGVEARVEQTPRRHFRVHYALSNHQPRVSLLIPTRDTLDYLRRCIESILTRTTYRNLEILLIDNGSVESETLAYLDRLGRSCTDEDRRTSAFTANRGTPRIRVLRDDRPFNFSALNNLAARHATGEAICLLNNDTEVITPDWIEVLLGHLIQSGVGVVGAKLYYSDGRIQHAGDTVGPGGCAHHLHAFLEREEPGYGDRAILAQDLSAVTAACLMTWRNLYLDLGGLDERNLPVAFNDVDYCLRVRESGRRVIWTPHAELYHHESVSRGKGENPKKVKRAARELAYMRKRWGHVMQHDPFYNQNLSYQRPDFSLSHMPSVTRPWL